MADRKEDRNEPGTSSTRGGTSRRGGFGEQQDAGGGQAGGSERDRSGPSSQPVKEGLEGAILDEGDDRASRSGSGKSGKSGKSTGAGGEAAEGIHNARGGGRDQSERSGVESAGTGRSASAQGDAEPTGSEPLEGRTREHQGGYGGSGGRPKTSSDQREPLDATGTLGDEEAGDGLGRGER